MGKVMKENVTEGDSVILPTGVNELHKGHKIHWWYEDNLIAEITGGEGKTHDVADKRFSGKLTLDKMTGDLNISDINTILSGLYKLTITRNRLIRHKRFILTVNPVTGEEMKVYVTEGNFANLRTAVTELQTDDEIQWCYGDTLIAEITGGKAKTYDVADKRFSGKLTLDKKTGKLNISDIKTIHSGLYKLRITRNRWIRDKRFIFTVNLNTVQVNVGEPLTLPVPSGAGLQKDDLILWKFGHQGSAIATFSRALKKTTTYDDPNGRFRDGLKLDDQTGSLTITNITTEHAGVYELQISNSEITINWKYRVTVTDLSKIYVVSEDSEMSGEYEKLSKKEVSVKEGATAHLEIGDENWENLEIIWKSGVKNFLIAKIKEGTSPITYDDVHDWRFKGRLELDKETGTLSINNTNTDDSGEYSVWIKRNTNKNTLLMFVVSVSGGSAGKVTGKKPNELKAENEASELVTVEIPLLSEEQQSSL